MRTIAQRDGLVDVANEADQVARVGSLRLLHDTVQELHVVQGVGREDAAILLHDGTNFLSQFVHKIGADNQVVKSVGMYVSNYHSMGETIGRRALTR